MQDRQPAFAPVTGDEFRPALGKLWAMLLVFALMVPIGALAAICWWFQIELVAGKVLTTTAGIVGLLGIPLGILLALVAFALLASAKRLIVGDSCIQLLKGEQVAVHIPYQNVAEVYFKGEGSAGVVGLKLRDRNDPKTLVPSWTKDRYEIQVLTYGRGLDPIHQAMRQRLMAFRAGGR